MALSNRYNYNSIWNDPIDVRSIKFYGSIAILYRIKHFYLFIGPTCNTLENKTLYNIYIITQYFHIYPTSI